ncbi:hypothetical protein ABBQ38_007638 [Trebouxia sp. C0009 RCD-2024]
MYSGHIAELAILWVCVVAFVGYHVWLYNFENPFFGLIRVPTTMARARQVWTRSICMDDKDVITGVQTIRNSLMTVTLFTVAAGYIGARAIPEILLTPDMLQQLNLIQSHDPITRSGNGTSLIQPSIKLGIGLGTLFICFLCFAQSARLYAHTGFLLKAQASKYKPSRWDFEGEALAIMGRAGLLFSIGIRCFFAFGILLLWILGPVALICATVATLLAFLWMDFLPAPSRATMHLLKLEEDTQ